MSKNKNLSALDNLGGLGEEETKEVEQKEAENNSKNVENDFDFRSVASQYVEKPKKAEDTHARATFFLPKETLSRLDKASKKYGKGFKSRIVSDAINKALDALEWETNKNK